MEEKNQINCVYQVCDSKCILHVYDTRIPES